MTNERIWIELKSCGFWLDDLIYACEEGDGVLAVSLKGDKTFYVESTASEFAEAVRKATQPKTAPEHHEEAALGAKPVPGSFLWAIDRVVRGGKVRRDLGGGDYFPVSLSTVLTDIDPEDVEATNWEVDNAKTTS